MNIVLEQKVDVTVHSGIFMQNNVFYFQKTQKPDSWNGVRFVGELPPACPQNPNMNYVNQHSPGFNKEDEDCLYINVYVPEVKWRPRPPSPSLYNLICFMFSCVATHYLA